MEVATLRELRAKSKLTIAEILRRMSAVSTDVPQSRHGYLHLEERGTTKMSVILGLSGAFDMPLTSVARAAEHTRSLSKKKVSS